LKEQVILVNERDEALGNMEKLEAHEKGLLHRAISVFVFNSKGEMLLQQRALHKYHSAGLWSNTCCSHPRPEESTASAASRRLKEEMGIVCDLIHKTEFVYKVQFENGLTEHEYDHVFTGIFNGTSLPNSEEVHDYRWISLPELEKECLSHPETYPYWFHLAWQKLKETY
jgi:isopentenyl-diphosphate Delta-isomerase